MSSDSSAPPAQDAERQRDAQLREGLYARKLALAILSTLQHKGVLSAKEVDSILLASKRAADTEFVPTQAVRSSFSPLPEDRDPARVRHQPKAPPIFDIQIDED
ncbi:hypothetical protein [Deinococcus sonorensis]|uniref:Uncharacterized protein n=2 Tax=Deinococcus sonorensis TaxID=309891 RepID=A0AAU7UFE6_9DEIO